MAPIVGLTLTLGCAPAARGPAPAAPAHVTVDPGPAGPARFSLHVGQALLDPANELLFIPTTEGLDVVQASDGVSRWSAKARPLWFGAVAGRSRLFASATLDDAIVWRAGASSGAGPLPAPRP